MDVRITRLQADQERIEAMLSKIDLIRLEEAIGNPPERYVLDYKVTGIVRNEKSGKIERSGAFRVEISLPDGYPRLAPQCRMVTPTFHPNVIDDGICVTDYWSAGSSLARLIVRIAELLTYQSYSLKFPLNPEAANWVEKHLHQLPTDATDFVAMLHAAEGVRRASMEDIRPEDPCVSCGALAERKQLFITDSNHLVCNDCMIRCSHCDAVMSEKSPKERCETCGEWACYHCIHRCLNCGVLICFNHMTRCGICDLGHCKQCLQTCHSCGTVVCVEHAAPAEREGKQVYLCENCLLQES